jgi:NTP pyrophosphatase (non-canonical NTP hydrolase)
VEGVAYWDPVNGMMESPSQCQLLHAGMGLVTEAGEFMDALKKHLIYGKPLDTVNLNEEIGDALWYIAMALRVTGMSFEDCMQLNIDKLHKRFPDKFTETEAIHRDTVAERKILEGPKLNTENMDLQPPCDGHTIADAAKPSIDAMDLDSTGHICPF